MAALLEVTSENELVALNRALIEAKFSGNACDRDVPASRFVAELSTRVASQLLLRQPNWKSWFTLDPSRREWSGALSYAISQRSWWRAASHQARVDAVKSILAPFQCDELVVEQFMTEVDAILSAGRWYSVWRKVKGTVVEIVTQRPCAKRHEEVEVVAGDGSSVIHSGADERTVAEWLVENGFEVFVEGAVLPPL